MDPKPILHDSCGSLIKALESSLHGLGSLDFEVKDEPTSRRIGFLAGKDWHQIDLTEFQNTREESHEKIPLSVTDRFDWLFLKRSDVNLT